MSNVNFCSCNDIYTRKRNHHGVVCTRCNPQNIESLLVPNEIKAYKTWNFDFEIGFSDNRMARQQGWSDFNILPPPNISKLDDYDFVKPWTIPPIVFMAIIKHLILIAVVDFIC